MRWLVVPVIVAQVASTAQAQPRSISGRVVDESGAPVANASILLGDETAVSDADGRFVIRGSGTLIVIAEHYATVAVTARPGVVVRIGKSEGEVIEISGKAPEEAKPLAYTLSAEDIASTPGAMNDALRAITILPAAARIPFSFGGVVLRGMSPRDSSVLIDGVEIPLAFHFGGITGVFPTQALAEMRVVPSGFDVSIGRTQGGVVELITRQPRGDLYRIGGEVSLLHSIVTGEGPLPRDGAFLATLRRSYLDVLVRPLVSANDPLPSYTDGYLRGVWGEPDKRGQLATYVFGSLDRVANSEDAASPTDPEAGGHGAINLGFVRAGASFKRRLDRTLYTVAPYVGTNILSLYTKDYEEGAPAPTVVDLSRRWYLFGTRASALRDYDRGFVHAGVELDGGYVGRVSQYTSNDTDGFPLPRNTVVWSSAAVFVETRRHWDDDRVSVRPGLRIERFGLGEQWAIDPRVNGHLVLTPTSTLRASLGRFHQPPSAAHFDEFADNLNAKASYVDQATLGVEVSPQQDLTASITAFFHDGRDTLVDIAENNIRPVGLDLEVIAQELLEEQIGLYGYQDNVGRQRSYGLETAVRYDTPRYRALANFTWARAKRRYEPARREGWVPYGLDQPIRMNLLFATSKNRWNFGARLTVASGNPLHLVPEGTPYDPELDEDPVQLMRLPLFWQLDVRIDRTWPKSWGKVMLFFDLQNITNHRNVEYRQSRLDDNDVYRYEDIRGLPIIPYIGVEFRPR